MWCNQVVISGVGMVTLVYALVCFALSFNSSLSNFGLSVVWGSFTSNFGKHANTLSWPCCANMVYNLCCYGHFRAVGLSDLSKLTQCAYRCPSATMAI